MAELTEKQYKRWEYQQRKDYRNGKLTKVQIRKLTEAGFVFELPDTAAENKAKLLEMARSGEPRPSLHKHPLGPSLVGYTSKKSKTYDVIFEKTIRELSPCWFDYKGINNERIKSQKLQLLKLATDGKPKPLQRKSLLGKAFSRFINPSGKSAFDSDFKKKIEEVSPNWLVNIYNQSISSKAKLIEMAENGLPRPIKGDHPLGYSLSNYTNRGSAIFDEAFDRKIKEIRPDWFDRSNSVSCQNKIHIIQIAKMGGEKPERGTLIGNALKNYIQKSGQAYDPEFDAEIRSLRPDWFKKKGKNEHKPTNEV